MNRKHRSEFFRPNGSDSDGESTIVEFAPEQFIDNLQRVEIDDVYFHSLEDGGEFSERSGGSESEGSLSNDDCESEGSASGSGSAEGDKESDESYSSHSSHSQDHISIEEKRKSPIRMQTLHSAPVTNEIPKKKRYWGSRHKLANGQEVVASIDDNCHTATQSTNLTRPRSHSNSSGVSSLTHDGTVLDDSRHTADDNEYAHVHSSHPLDPQYISSLVHMQAQSQSHGAKTHSNSSNSSPRPHVHKHDQQPMWMQISDAFTQQSGNPPSQNSTTYSRMATKGPPVAHQQSYQRPPVPLPQNVAPAAPTRKGITCDDGRAHVQVTARAQVAAPPLSLKQCSPAPPQFIDKACLQRPEEVELAMQRERVRVDRGCDVAGNTLMHLACDVGNLSLVSYLCSKFPAHSFAHPNHSGLYPIHVACMKGFTHIVKVLGDAPSSTCLRTRVSTSALGWTPLHFAVSGKASDGSAAASGSVQVVKYLISRLAVEDVWAKDDSGMNSLHLACVYNCTAVVLAMTGAPKADLFAPDGEGRRSVDILAVYGHLSTLKKIFERAPQADKHAILRSAGPTGATCLHWAVAYKKYDVMVFLLSNGADAASKDSQGRTPSDMTSDSKCKEMCIFFRTGTDVISTPKCEDDKPSPPKSHRSTEISPQEFAPTREKIQGSGESSLSRIVISSHNNSLKTRKWGNLEPVDSIRDVMKLYKKPSE